MMSSHILTPAVVLVLLLYVSNTLCAKTRSERTIIPIKAKIGILMCRDVCVQTVGCKSYSYRKETLRCEVNIISSKHMDPGMMSMTADISQKQEGIWSTCDIRICKLTDKLICSKKHTCKCVHRSEKKREKQPTKEIIENTRHNLAYVTVSSRNNSIIYGHARRIHLIDPVVVLKADGTQEVRELLLLMTGLVTEHTLWTIFGMTAGRCRNKKKYCIYILSYQCKSRKNEFEREVQLIFIEEPDIQKKTKQAVVLTRQKVTFSKIVSVKGISLDGKLNLYILLSNRKGSDIFFFTNANGHYRMEVETRRFQYQVFAMDVKDNGEKFIVFTKRSISVVERNEVAGRDKKLTYVNHTWETIACFMRSEGVLNLVERQYPHHIKSRDVWIAKH